MTTETGLTWTDHDVTLRRLEWMSDAQWVKVRDAMGARFAAEGLIPTGLTCPWWCTRADALHVRGESEAGGGQVLRIHSHEYGDGLMAVVQDETVEEGVTIWARPEIHTYGVGDPESADEARVIGGWFIEAGDLLEQVTTGGAR